MDFSGYFSVKLTHLSATCGREKGGREWGRKVRRAGEMKGENEEGREIIKKGRREDKMSVNEGELDRPKRKRGRVW